MEKRDEPRKWMIGLTNWWQVSDVFARVRYEKKHELKNAIEATGHKLEDIKKM